MLNNGSVKEVRQFTWKVVGTKRILGIEGNESIGDNATLGMPRMVGIISYVGMVGMEGIGDTTGFGRLGIMGTDGIGDKASLGSMGIVGIPGREGNYDCYKECEAWLFLYLVTTITANMKMQV